jgi:hypothetical protein
MDKQVSIHSSLSIHNLSNIHHNHPINNHMVNRSILSSMGSLNTHNSMPRLAINLSQ